MRYIFIIFTILFNGGQALQAFHGCRNNLNYSLEFNLVTETLNLTKMNYQKIYSQIIEKAKSKNRKKLKRDNPDYVYYERHHILPKCLGGGNEKENLVLLTGREHFIAHKLLYYINPKNSGLMYAYRIMTLGCHPNQKKDYKITSREYEELKIAFSKTHSNRVVSDKVKAKQSKAQFKLYDNGYISPKKNKPVSEEIRLKIAKTLTGLTHSEDTKIKMKKSHAKNPKIKCKYCNRLVDAGNYKQYHGENCKKNPNYIPEPRLKCLHCNNSFTKRTYKMYHGENCRKNPNFDKSKLLVCKYCGLKTLNKGVFNRSHDENCKSKC